MRVKRGFALPELECGCGIQIGNTEENIGENVAHFRGFEVVALADFRVECGHGFSTVRIAHGFLQSGQVRANCSGMRRAQIHGNMHFEPAKDAGWDRVDGPHPLNGTAGMGDEGFPSGDALHFAGENGLDAVLQ